MMHRRFLLVCLALLLGVGGWLLLRRAKGPAGGTIVLVTIDTLRRDAVGAYRPPGAPSLTPRLDEFVKQAAIFEDARTPVPLTLPAHTTMMSGLPPAVTGVRLNSHGRIPPPGPRKFPLLAERLRESGWHTAAFVSAAPLVRRYGLDQGFEHYDDGGGALEDSVGVSYAKRPGAQTVASALKHVGSLPRDAPLFLWIHLFDPHAPYDLTYEEGVERADAAVGALLAGLADSGRGDAAVLVTADHGEARGEHLEPSHGRLLGDATLRVPFLLRAPGALPGRRPGPVDLADVAPTLASVAGLPWPRRYGETPGAGTDLLGGAPSSKRLRVVESLWVHQQYRWAQLTAAVDSEGRTLVEFGGGRSRLLVPAPPGEPQSTPAPSTNEKSAPALAAFIGQYKRSEDPSLIQEGGAPGGYGASGRAQPFLSSEENGRLPDPYERIPASTVLEQRGAAVYQGAIAPPKAAAELRKMSEADPGNPEILFWEGFALLKTDDRRSAAAPLLKAWRLGRREPQTLLLLVDSTAAGHEAEALQQLEELGKQIAWNCELHVLRVRLLRALHRDAEAEDACGKAGTACSSPKERRLMESLRSGGTCPK